MAAQSSNTTTDKNSEASVPSANGPATEWTTNASQSEQQEHDGTSDHDDNRSETARRSSTKRKSKKSKKKTGKKRNVTASQLQIIRDHIDTLKDQLVNIPHRDCKPLIAQNS